jgi:hypothetical protein
MTDVQSLDAGTPGAIEPFGFGPVGNHDDDRRVEASIGNRVDECLKIAAAA